MKTNIPWIGDIPNDWKLIRLKDWCSYKKEIAGPESENFERLALTLNGVIKRAKDDADGLQPKEFDTYQILRKNDFIFKMIDLQNISTSRVGLSPFTGLVSPAYIRFAAKDTDQFNDFIYYYLMSLYYNCVFNNLGGDGVRSSLNATDMGNLKCPFPSISTQKQIVEFLNKKLNEIDKLIQIQNQQIDILKEYRESIISEAVTKGLDKNVTTKDSETKWIGLVPIHWTMKKMGWIADYKKGPFGSSLKVSMFVDKAEGTFKVYEQKNAIYKDAKLGSYYITKSKFNELSSFEVIPGDIIVSCAGTIGECYQLPADSEKGIINQALMRVRLKDSVLPKYFLYLFNTVISKASQIESNGSAMKNIPPFDVLKNFRIFLPEESEQKRIIEYLDNKCKDIDLLVSIKQMKIDVLSQYKKSLIYECVTGKKEVG